jgi:hypothetical protein
VVVQRFCKPKVGGSNPSPGTIISRQSTRCFANRAAGRRLTLARRTNVHIYDAPTHHSDRCPPSGLIMPPKREGRCTRFEDRCPRFEDRCMLFEDRCMLFEDRCMQFKDGHVRGAKPCSGFGCLSQASNAAIICASGLGRIRKVDPPCGGGCSTSRHGGPTRICWLYGFIDLATKTPKKPKNHWWSRGESNP